MFQCFNNTDRYFRQNPAVVGAAHKVLKAIAQALEAETLQGVTAQRVAAAAKHLVHSTGINASGID